MIHATYSNEGVATITIGDVTLTEADLVAALAAARREATTSAAYQKQQESYREMEVLYQAERERSQQAWEQARSDRTELNTALLWRRKWRRLAWRLREEMAPTRLAPACATQRLSCGGTGYSRSA